MILREIQKAYYTVFLVTQYVICQEQSIFPIVYRIYVFKYYYTEILIIILGNCHIDVSLTTLVSPEKCHIDVNIATLVSPEKCHVDADDTTE